MNKPGYENNSIFSTLNQCEKHENLWWPGRGY